MISASQNTSSHYNLKILRPKVTKNLKNLPTKFCEFRPWYSCYHFTFDWWSCQVLMSILVCVKTIVTLRRQWSRSRESLFYRRNEWETFFLLSKSVKWCFLADIMRPVWIRFQDCRYLVLIKEYRYRMFTSRK